VATAVIGLTDVEAAADRIRPFAHRTPVVTSRTLDAATGGSVHLKAENLQRMGAFKFRGATNAVAALTPDERARGLLAFSSGNHAQAVALAARLHDTHATIVMPLDAPASKVAATRGYGAEVVTYDRYTEDRAAIAARLADETGAVLIPPYDHEHVMAGQGTTTLELVEDVADLDLLLVPVGGGGLIAGCATVAAAHGVEVIGVEPEARTAGRDAIAAGRVVTNPIARTIADGQQTPSIGELTTPVILERVSGIVGIADDRIVDTMRWAFERLKLVLEPSGASALAALRAGTVDTHDRRVAVVLSGGNVSADRFRELLG
jgi:threonine dehydratase